MLSGSSRIVSHIAAFFLPRCLQNLPSIYQHYSSAWVRDMHVAALRERLDGDHWNVRLAAVEVLGKLNAAELAKAC